MADTVVQGYDTKPAMGVAECEAAILAAKLASLARLLIHAPLCESLFDENNMNR